MDVLEQVRELGVISEPLEEEALNSVRATLLQTIANEKRAVRIRRRWAGATVLAGGLAATIIAMSVLAPTRVDPAAAAVLEKAAEVTINAVDTQLAPGQFLRIQTDVDTLMKWDIDMGESWARFNNGNRADAEAAFIERDTRVLYVPADRSGDWIWDQSAEDAVVTTFGDRVGEAISDWDSMQSDSGYWPDVQVLPGGEVQAAPDDNHEYLIDNYRRHYDEMPRDPQELLDWFRDRSGDPQIADQWVVDGISEALSANLMPADIRAATFRALALIPGIEVASVKGDSTTLVYRSGDLMWDRTTDITINTVQGVIKSVTQAYTNKIRGSEMLPRTIPDSRTTVTVAVTDAAPQPSN